MGDSKLVIPYEFCGKQYHYKADLAKAFMQKWDLAAAALKRGAIADYFLKLMEADPKYHGHWKNLYKKSRNLQEDMWNDQFHEDIVFGKFMYYFYLLRNGSIPPMPMDDIDVSKSKIPFSKADDKLADRYRYRYGSRTGENRYDEACYIAYMNKEARDGMLYMIPLRGDGRDDRKPDESAGKKPESRRLLEGTVRVDRARWWQEYLMEIGKFER